MPSRFRIVRDDDVSDDIAGRGFPSYDDAYDVLEHYRIIEEPAG
jgi:hypothetical protein